jgi:hypothetical protein
LLTPVSKRGLTPNSLDPLIPFSPRSFQSSLIYAFASTIP